MLVSCNRICLSNKATTITPNPRTLIDHMQTKDKISQVTADIIISDLSDHYGLNAIIKNCKIHVKNRTEELKVRDMTNFILDKLKILFRQ